MDKHWTLEDRIYTIMYKVKTQFHFTEKKLFEWWRRPNIHLGYKTPEQMTSNIYDLEKLERFIREILP
jgi:hypothetical protein